MLGNGREVMIHLVSFLLRYRMVPGITIKTQRRVERGKTSISLFYSPGGGVLCSFGSSSTNLLVSTSVRSDERSNQWVIKYRMFAQKSKEVADPDDLLEWEELILSPLNRSERLSITGGQTTLLSVWLPHDEKMQLCSFSGSTWSCDKRKSGEETRLKIKQNIPNLQHLPLNEGHTEQDPLIRTDCSSHTLYIIHST